MNISYSIAKRYFFSWKKKTIINIISIFALVGTMVGTMALIVILSAFNGMDSFVRSLFGKFDSDLVILPVEGKTFETNPEWILKIKQTEGVAIYSEIIEDNALLKYRENQQVVKIKGVESHYLENHSIDSSIIQGSIQLITDSIEYAIVGLGIKDNLNLVFDKNMYPLQFLYPKNKKIVGTIDPNQLLNRQNIHFGGVFAVERQYDLSYVFVPLAFAERLTDFKDKRTSIEIKVSSNISVEATKNKLQSVVGKEFKVLDSADLHQSLFKAHNIEKFLTFLIFSFILLIASLNIFFVLSMLVMEKKKDIAIMKSMGFSKEAIYKIYIINAFYISFSGAFLGLVFGYLLLFLQQHFGLVSMGMSSGLVDAYPVEMRWTDFVSVIFIVLIVTMLVAIFPAKKASNIQIHEEL